MGRHKGEKNHRRRVIIGRKGQGQYGGEGRKGIRHWQVARQAGGPLSRQGNHGVRAQGGKGEGKGR